VECIFLDEGFGTLSGEPLNEAINALKRLSTTGKMLGIITHMEAVIQAFQNIEAVKHGEKSILVGPGVRCSEAEKKKKKKE
jgi:DNA repair exonuclease SbcCD ATPase subunit